MEKYQMNDKVFEGLFAQAVIDNFYEEYNALPSLEILSRENIVSERFDKRMKALLKKEEHKERWKKFVNNGRKVAAVFLIFITVFAGMLMINPTVRAAVDETIISWHKEYVKFISPAAEAEGASMVPNYIPVGFSENHREDVNDTTIILYSNEVGEVIIFQSSRAAGSLYVDNENASYEILDIAGIIYHVLSSLDINEENTIIWEVYGWRYILRSSIDAESLLRIALSLEENEQ
ncbi:MAG: DUF4367 domain-containing protein [Oscillospiraceae bacterium]|jgi:hypothetical protein|nr:DUF4367 domain-containing protein [Oscillospiraceae bacterium]